KHQTRAPRAQAKVWQDIFNQSTVAAPNSSITQPRCSPASVQITRKIVPTRLEPHQSHRQPQMLVPRLHPAQSLPAINVKFRFPSAPLKKTGDLPEPKSQRPAYNCRRLRKGRRLRGRS
ncbi:hypothetical protein PoMZ_13593, partial [Pyricularia oryzae]